MYNVSKNHFDLRFLLLFTASASKWYKLKHKKRKSYRINC